MGNVSGVVTPTNKTNFEEAVAAAAAELPFLKSATKKERMELVKMGLKNTGFVNAVYTGIGAHLGILPSDFNMAAFTEDIKLKQELPYLKQLLVGLVEKMDDTDLLLGNDLMVAALYVYSLMKVAAKNNAEIKTLVDEIAENWINSGKKKANTVFSIASSSTITVANVVASKSFLNNGITLLKLKVGADLVSKFPLADPITVDPGNSVKIPKGWTIIEVTNLSGTAAGSFSIKIK